MAVALYQRGLLLLHASAVALSNSNGSWGAVGFLGNSGEGKSTMAATLHARGHLLMTDDFLAVPTLTSRGNFPLVAPGVGQLNLWPETLEALCNFQSFTHNSTNESAYPQLWAHEDKRVWRTEERFANQSVPLRRLYILETNDVVACQKLSTAQALKHLMQHSYCAGFLPSCGNGAAFQRINSADRTRISVSPDKAP